MKSRTEVYVSHYLSPLGNMFMLADENGLKGLWFAFQKDYVNAVDAGHILAEEPFEETKRWQDAYFEGLHPVFTPKFQLDVTPLRNTFTTRSSSYLRKDRHLYGDRRSRHEKQ